MTQRLFISDLHLSPEQPALLACFLGFLGERAPAAAELYILGDLFDAWIGDDDQTPETLQVIASLRKLTDGGTRCSLLHGNRDFLIGRRFARASGCRLLRDPSLVRMANASVLLMHGDLLCTDDMAYQRFRRKVRNPVVKQLFLLRPLRRRRQIAADYRRLSREALAAKQAKVMDVNPQTVASYLQRYRADRLIHGHTHRPADHRLLIDQRQCHRQVLADWRVLDSGVEAQLLAEENEHWWRESIGT